MKWFDTKEIKNEQELSPEQIAYLRESSVTIFGPFNVLVRKQWDLLLASVLLGLVFGFVWGFISAALFHDFIGNLTPGNPHYLLYQTVNDVIGVVVVLALYGTFGYKQGRRLAWNRNNWKSFDEFKQSEEKWHIWGCIGLAIALAKPAIEVVALIVSYLR